MQRAYAAVALVLSMFIVLAVPAQAASLTVSVDKDEYRPGETVVITVVVEDNATSAAVAVTVYDPMGTLVYTEQLSLRFTNNIGAASTSFVLPPDAEPGNWLVKAQYGNISAEDAFQVIQQEEGVRIQSTQTQPSIWLGAAMIAMAFITVALMLRRRSPSKAGKR